MNLKKTFGSKTVGGYINLAAAVIALLSLILYVVYSAQLGKTNAVVIVFLVLAVLGAVALFFYDNAFLAVATSVFMAVGFGAFVTGSEVVGSVVDSIQGIVMFGHAEFVGIIFTTAGFALVGVILTIVTCFQKRVK